MFNDLYKRILEKEDIFKASTPEEGERRSKEYKDMMIKKFKEGPDQSDAAFLDFVETIEYDFISPILDLDEIKQFKKDYLSEKYIWKFKVYEMETEEERDEANREIKNLVKNGWKIYKKDDNGNSMDNLPSDNAIALIFTKRAPK